MITIFTPTYNRAGRLKKLYDSLLAQTNYDFEWLIIDDGSTDNTKNVIDDFINDNVGLFEIRYVFQENGGKHRAINNGVRLANGELFFIVDSDDWLPKDSIKTIYYYYNSILDTNMNAGVAGCKYKQNGVLFGTTFEGDFVDATSLEREKYNISGEKAEVFRTSLLRNYPFPEYENENFISEAIVWNKMAHDGYWLRWFNKNIYYAEYLEDGLTNNLRKNYERNPKGYLLYVSSEIKYHNVPLLKKYIWCGKCIHTVNNSIIKKSEVCDLLNITDFEFRFSIFIYKIYKLIRTK